MDILKNKSYLAEAKKNLKIIKLKKKTIKIFFTIIALITKWETAFASDKFETTRRSLRKAVPRRGKVISIIQAWRSLNNFKV
jgi:hypothetical protein